MTATHVPFGSAASERLPDHPEAPESEGVQRRRDEQRDDPLRIEAVKALRQIPEARQVLIELLALYEDRDTLAV